MSRVLVVNVAELRKRPASRRHVQASAPVPGIAVIDSRVPEGAEADVDLELESLTDGIVVTGRVAAPWEGVCRRCLRPVSGSAEVAVREVFAQRPATDDVLPYDGDQIDLEPLVREAVMLELPLAPLCRPDCAGLCPACGVDRNEVDCGHDVAPSDPRWAALDALRDELKPPS